MKFPIFLLFLGISVASNEIDELKSLVQDLKTELEELKKVTSKIDNQVVFSAYRYNDFSSQDLILGGDLNFNRIIVNEGTVFENDPKIVRRLRWKIPLNRNVSILTFSFHEKN